MPSARQALVELPDKVNRGVPIKPPSIARNPPRLSGAPGLHLITGFHDETLSEKWRGFRSFRLGDQWRMIYRAIGEASLFQVVSHMSGNKSIDFFDRQFRERPSEAALQLNPFEVVVLPYLRGSVLDFGCGMGNLAFAAARRGCAVTALDASPAAIAHIERRAAAEAMPVVARIADLRDYSLSRDFDCIVSIGLLMFFDCPTAFRVLRKLQSRVRPGGLAAINVLIEGTSYLDMFDPSGHCLFAPNEMERRFAGWEVLHSTFEDFEAPRNSIKRFTTIVARKPR